MGQKTSEYDPKNPPTIQKTPQNLPKHVKIYHLKSNRKNLQKSPENLSKFMKNLRKPEKNHPKIVKIITRFPPFPNEMKCNEMK